MLLLVVWSGFSRYADAQQPYYLSELVVIALQENYQLQIVRNRERMAENLNTPGNAGMLPTVGVSANHNSDVMTTQSTLYTGMERVGTNALSTRTGAMAELNWTVFDGFSMFAHRDRLGLLAAISRSETRFYIEQTVSDLAHSYHLLVRELLLLETYQSISEVSALRVALERQKREIGSGNTLQFNQALLDFHTDSLRVLQQQQRVADQQYQINKILNRPSELLPLPVDTALVARGLQPVEQLLEMATRHNPYLEVARLEEMVSEAGSRIAMGGRYPHVDLFSNYQYNHQTSETGIIESATNRGAQFGIRIRFNLYDGGRQNTVVNNAAITRESAALHTTDLQVTLKNDLELLRLRHINLTRQLNLLLESRNAAEQTLSIAEEQFRTGAISGFEFRHTQLNILRLQQQLIDIQFALVSIETDIDRICGVLTENIINQSN